MFACHYFGLHQVFSFYSSTLYIMCWTSTTSTIWKCKCKVIYIGSFPIFWRTSYLHTHAKNWKIVRMLFLYDFIEPIERSRLFFVTLHIQRMILSSALNCLDAEITLFFPLNSFNRTNPKWPHGAVTGMRAHQHTHTHKISPYK